MFMIHMRLMKPPDGVQSSQAAPVALRWHPQTSGIISTHLADSTLPRLAPPPPPPPLR